MRTNFQRTKQVYFVCWLNWTKFLNKQFWDGLQQMIFEDWSHTKHFSSDKYLQSLWNVKTLDPSCLCDIIYISMVTEMCSVESYANVRCSKCQCLPGVENCRAANDPPCENWRIVCSSRKLRCWTPRVELQCGGRGELLLDPIPPQPTFRWTSLNISQKMSHLPSKL